VIWALKEVLVGEPEDLIFYEWLTMANLLWPLEVHIKRQCWRFLWMNTYQFQAVCAVVGDDGHVDTHEITAPHSFFSLTFERRFYNVDIVVKEK
jgi:hypothetical protein